MLEERKALALKLLKEGRSRKYACAKAGVGKETIQKIAKQHRIRVLAPSEYRRPKQIIRCPNGHLIKTKECLQCISEKSKLERRLSAL